jgi:putative spermidine/putrescine transport system substrate-binding protein
VRITIAGAVAAAAALALTGGAAYGAGAGASASAGGMPTSIGKGEGALNLVAWEGYTQDQWVKPFEKQTGCQVNVKYAGSSDEMVTLMRGGGGYDLVSASGDASNRLIAGGIVVPVNVNLIPGWRQFLPALQSPPHNTVGGKHYGVSYMWGPNVLMWNTKKMSKPTSWAAIYNPANKGKITVPDNPIQIADAALYLKATKPSLRIKDVYELTSTQLDAAVKLLEQQKPLIKKYWALASDEIDLFKNGGVTIGAAWPYQVTTLEAAKVPVSSIIPKEGATGWADTWMLSSKAPHPNCAYMWMRYASTAKVQAEVAQSYGATPSNKLSCALLGKKACLEYHANADAKYFKQIAFWKTPISDCGNGQRNCEPYTVWQQKWTELRG